MTKSEKKVWEKMEKIGWETKPEGLLLEFYKNIIECTKKLKRNEYKKHYEKGWVDGENHVHENCIPKK